MLICLKDYQSAKVVFYNNFEFIKFTVFKKTSIQAVARMADRNALQ